MQITYQKTWEEDSGYNFVCDRRMDIYDHEVIYRQEQ